MTGLVVSFTVFPYTTLFRSPAASVAVTVMVWTPRPTSVPAAGLRESVLPLSTLLESLTVAAPRTLGTAAWQVPSALAAGMTEQVTTGLVVSITVKVVEQESLLPAASVAVNVKVLTPIPLRVHAAGL